MLPLVYTLFAISGFVGLCYESLWAQYLKLFLGHSSYGQVLTICIYMGGLGIGSFLGGRIASRVKAPFLLYAAVEAGIGLCGLFYHECFQFFTGLFYAVAPSLPANIFLITGIKLAVSLLVTLPVAILLGITFPAIAIGAMRLAGDKGKRTIGRLYFVNSLGAAAGIMVCSYFLIPRFGLPGALVLAAIGNFLVAGGFFAVSKGQLKSTGTVVHPDTAVMHPGVHESLALPRSVLLWLCVAGLTGLSSFIYEIGWIRLLSLVFGSSTHSFDIMISAFILGLALGSFSVGRVIVRSKNIVGALIAVQLAMGVAATLSVFLYKPVFLLMGEWHNIFQRTDEAYIVFSVFKYLIAVLLMCPTSFFAGMTLPIITYALSAATGREEFTGKVYGWNTIGAIIGAIVGGLFLLPFLQLKNTIVFGAAIDITIAIVLLYLFPSPIKKRIVFSCVAIAVLVPTQMIRFESALLASGVFRTKNDSSNDHVKVTIRDGRTASISFHEANSSGMRVCSIRTNGKADASLAFGVKAQRTDLPTQAALAYLPISLLHQKYSAAVIGMGSGMTAHMLLGDDSLQSLDVVEIEPEMVRLAKGFLPANRRVYEDPRSQIVVDDAKTYFQSRHGVYDLIISEPSNPWVSGVASLFSVEFYKLLTHHLRPGGILVQWLHMYEFDDELLLSIIKALHHEFRYVQIYTTPLEREDIIILGSNTPLPLPDSTRLALQPKIVADYSASSIVFPLADFVKGRYLVSAQSLEPLLSNAMMNSDFIPVVDNGAEKAFFKKSSVSFLRPFFSRGPQNPLWILEPDRAAINEHGRSERKLAEVKPARYGQDSLFIRQLEGTSADWEYLENRFIQNCGFTFDTTFWDLAAVHAYEKYVNRFGPADYKVKANIALSSCRRDTSGINLAVIAAEKTFAPNTLDPELAAMLTAGCISVGLKEQGQRVFRRYLFKNPKVSKDIKILWASLCGFGDPKD